MTGKTEFFNGIPIQKSNTITDDTLKYYISYNDRDAEIYGCDTTALVITKNKNPEKFLILNGNHTDAYNAIKETGGAVEDCIDYFKNNHDKQSKFSEK